MNNEPVAWMYEKPNGASKLSFVKEKMLWEDMTETPLYAHPVKTLTDEDIAKVVHELNQKARTPERWVTAMEIGAETIIQLRDELRKAQEK
jgi:hypothetical protein